MTTEITTPIRTALPIAQLPPMVLNIQNVSKQYNKKNWGLRDFTLEIGPGVLGLLGPNGAGKSTLMRILATITKATTGSVTWNGTDIAKSPDELARRAGIFAAGFWRVPEFIGG